jgi:hypothetical protein
VLRGAKQGVAGVFHGLADDHPVFDTKLGNSLLTLPATQCFPIE